MPHRRHAYRFEAARPERDGDRDVLVVPFASAITRSRLELIAAPSGHDDCFDWSGPLASRGRIVIDAEGLDVLRVEQFLPGPVEVRLPPLFQRRHHFDNWISLVRDDMTIRYARVAFDDPDEVLLLPEAIDTVTIVRGGLQSTRRSHRFSDYRRFVTGGRVIR